ncbi:MAG: hypothetical protein NC127_09605, partial [Muribaculum sp.]|nr:hypothetical protein [Muribaculum sp.]
FNTYSIISCTDISACALLTEMRHFNRKCLRKLRRVRLREFDTLDECHLATCLCRNAHIYIVCNL